MRYWIEGNAELTELTVSLVNAIDALIRHAVCHCLKRTPPLRSGYAQQLIPTRFGNSDCDYGSQHPARESQSPQLPQQAPVRAPSCHSRHLLEPPVATAGTCWMVLLEPYMACQVLGSRVGDLTRAGESSHLYYI